MASLYELTQDFLMIAHQLEEMDLEEVTIQDTLESLKQPIDKKAENIIKFIRNLETMGEMRKAEAKRLTELAAKDFNKADKLTAYLDETMKQLGKTKMNAGVFQLSYRKGSEVVEINEKVLPKKYWVKQDPKPISKIELRTLLKDGTKIKGVELVRKPDSLVIK